MHRIPKIRNVERNKLKLRRSEFPEQWLNTNKLLSSSVKTHSRAQQATNEQAFSS